jgi:hypothetical protein
MSYLGVLLTICIIFQTNSILYNDHLSASKTLLAAPIDLYSTNGVLDVTLTTNIFRQSNGIFSFNTRAYCLNGACSVPAPTLHLYPGDLLRFYFCTAIDYEHFNDILSHMFCYFLFILRYYRTCYWILISI